MSTVRRRWLHAVVVAGCSAAALTLWACGLNVLGGATPEDRPADAGAERAVANNDPDATPQAVECSSDRTTCGEKCVDLSIDPANCGKCATACAEGENCSDGGCGVLCLTDTVACSNRCVDPKTDPQHCGSCTNDCGDGGTPFCADGGCVPDCASLGLALCPPTATTPAPYCADTKIDPKNCGACGKVCANNQVCTGSQCVDLCATGREIGDLFAGNMTGCKAKVTYANRGAICPTGSHVCTAAEWVAKRSGKAPSFIYWVNENLAYYGSNQNCEVDVVSAASRYNSCNNPMRVCNNYSDALGNECYWKNCGYKSRAPNQYFGGCTGNTTAGALCCKNN